MIATVREGRQGIDLVKDDVEHSLDKEVENIRNYQVLKWSGGKTIEKPSMAMSTEKTLTILTPWKI